MTTNTQILWESVKANPGKTAQWHEAHLDFKATTSIMTNMQKRGMVRRAKQKHFNDNARMVVAYHYEVVGTTYKFMPLPPNVVKEAAAKKRSAQVMLGTSAGNPVADEAETFISTETMTAQGSTKGLAKARKPRTLTPADCGLTNEKFATAYEETAADLVDRLPIRRAKEVFVILQGIFGV